MTPGGAEGAENLCCGIDFSVGKEYGGGGVRHGRRWKDSRHSGERRTVKKSTGIGGKSHEPVSHTLGEFMKDSSISMIFLVGISKALSQISFYIKQQKKENQN